MEVTDSGDGTGVTEISVGRVRVTESGGVLHVCLHVCSVVMCQIRVRGKCSYYIMVGNLKVSHCFSYFSIKLVLS